MKNIIAGVSVSLARVEHGAARQQRTAGSARQRTGRARVPMTFGCPKAALNAAAREATKVRSQGTYQFSYFKILNDSHHATYEVHFTSNFTGEKALNYCVAIYCQQGWDPRTTKTTVTLMARPGEDLSPLSGHRCADRSLRLDVSPFRVRYGRRFHRGITR